jgi:hypothetical protein
MEIIFEMSKVVGDFSLNNKYKLERKFQLENKKV